MFFVMAAWIMALSHTARVVRRPLSGVRNDQGLLKRAEAEDTGSICLSAVFFLNVLLFLYGIHRNIIRRNAVKKGLRWSDKAETAVLVLVIAVILIVYVIRLIRQDSP